MKITGIEATKKGRYALFVDGEFMFSVHHDTFLTVNDLARGAEISGARLEEIRQEDELRSAKERALDLLSRAEYPSMVLYQKLIPDYSPEASAAAVRRMGELGLINDRDYGTRLAADYVNLRHYPLRRIEMELSKRGFEREMIEEILSVYTEESQSDAAAAVIRRKYERNLTDKKGIDKTIAALLRRGFRMEDIRGGLRQVLDEERSNAPSPESEEPND